VTPVASNRLLKVLIVTAVAAILAWYSFAASMGQIFQARQAELALRFDPGNGFALSTAAFDTLAALRDRKDLNHARELAFDALRATPGDARAIFVAAATADEGRATPQAVERVKFSLKFSRRNPAAYIWLIEERTAAGDVDGALDHYDLAMRSSAEARSTLLPIMISAMDDPALSGPIGNVLARGANWTILFWEQVIQAEAMPTSAGAIITRLAGSKGFPPKGIGDYVIQRLVENLRFDEATQVAALYYPELKAQDQARSAGLFLTPGVPSPFAWQLFSDADVGANATAPDRLSMSLFTPNGGLYARKLLQLAPGEYSIDATMTSEVVNAIGAPRIRMRCASDNSPLFEASSVPGAQGRGVFRSTFAVPVGCRAEWLEILSPSSETSNGNWELSAFRISKRGAP